MASLLGRLINHWRKRRVCEWRCPMNFGGCPYLKVKEEKRPQTGVPVGYSWPVGYTKVEEKKRPQTPPLLPGVPVGYSWNGGKGVWEKNKN